MINKTELEKKNGQMGLLLWDNIAMDLNKGRVCSSGLMEAAIRETFTKVRYTVRERINGKIVNTQGNGKTIRCMEKAYSAGILAKNIEEAT